MNDLQEIEMSRKTCLAALAAVVFAYGATVPALADTCTDTIVKVEEAAGFL